MLKNGLKFRSEDGQQYMITNHRQIIQTVDGVIEVLEVMPIKDAVQMNKTKVFKAELAKKKDQDYKEARGLA